MSIVKEDYNSLNAVIKAGILTCLEVGAALAVMHKDKVYKQGGYKTWESYLESEVGISRSHSYRIMKTAKVAEEHQIEDPKIALAAASLPDEHRTEAIQLAKGTGCFTPEMIQDQGEVVRSNHAKRIERYEPEDILGQDDYQAAVDSLQQALRHFRAVTSGDKGKPAASFMMMGKASVLSSIENALSRMKANQMLHVCWSCQGRGCKCCHDTGFVSCLVHDNRPDEFKQ